MAKKAYVVWVGEKPGVYKTWSETKAQTDGYPGAKFRGFNSVAEAQAAFNGDAPPHKPSQGGKSQAKQNSSPSRPTGMYLTVDAAYSHSTKVLEWRGVLVDGSAQTEVFRSKQYQGGSANVGELLGIVDGMRYLREKELFIPLYSDSYNAQSWAKRKTHNSSAYLSDDLSERLEDGVRYLKDHPNKGPGQYIQIVDWETRLWGEIPADFGRK